LDEHADNLRNPVVSVQETPPITALANGRLNLPLDRQGNLTNGPPFAIAQFKIVGGNAGPNIELDRIETFDDDCKFEVQYVGGPAEGVIASELPPIFGPTEVRFLIGESNERVGPDERATRLAIYQRHHEEGEFTYRFERIDDNPESVSEAKQQILVQWATDTTNRFYLEPNYAIYSTPQPPAHEQVQISLGHRKAAVDKGIADVIVAL
jgi:hypothetical protein